LFPREQTQRPPDTPHLGCFCVCSRNQAEVFLMGFWR
jgi:hypothetical protein